MDGENTKSAHRDKADPPQLGDLKNPTLCGRLRACTAKFESSGRRPDAGFHGHRDDLGIIHVSDNEGSSASPVGLQKNLVITKSTDFEELKTLFDIAQKLIQEQKQEIKRGLNDRMACFSSEKICSAT